MSEIRYELQVETFKKLQNPYNEITDGKKNPVSYQVLIDIKELPDGINMETNPRFQNMRTGVVRKIKESLLLDDKCFFLKNRGILISAKEIKYNNKTKQLNVLFTDSSVHGCVDGGHTFKAIQLMKDKINHSHYVRLEIMTDIEDSFEAIASARNTSASVSESSIAELKNNFQFIKDIINKEPFSNNIAYKENDDEKNIEISYIISLLYMFNLDRLSSSDNVPVQACSSTQTCMKNFLETYREHEENIETNPYYKQKNILIDIFKIHDKLQKQIGVYYQGYFSKGKYGLVKSVSSGRYKTTFYEEDTDYLSPKGFILPIIGSLRSLLIEKNGLYEWVEDPFIYLDKIGKDLVGETIERYRSLGNSPGNVGKDSNHWKSLYRRVSNEYLQSLVEINK